MVALAEAAPQVDGCPSADVTMAVRAVHEEWPQHQPNVAAFWLLPGGKERRKKIVLSVFQQVRAVVMGYWGQQDLGTVRLYGFLVKLKSFLLSHGGQGLWSCFSAQRWVWEGVEERGMSGMSVPVCHTMQVIMGASFQINSGGHVNSQCFFYLARAAQVGDRDHLSTVCLSLHLCV